MSETPIELRISHSWVSRVLHFAAFMLHRPSLRDTAFPFMNFQVKEGDKWKNVEW